MTTFHPTTDRADTLAPGDVTAVDGTIYIRRRRDTAQFLRPER